MHLILSPRHVPSLTIFKTKIEKRRRRKKYENSIQHVCHLMVEDSESLGGGHFCLVPRFASDGDQICIPFGSRVPFVFRPSGEEYLNIGECYVHGAMDGEALAWDSIREIDFVLR